MQLRCSAGRLLRIGASVSLRQMEESQGKTCLGEAAGSVRVLGMELFCGRAGGDPAAPLCLPFGFGDVQGGPLCPKHRETRPVPLETLRCGF